MMAPLHAQLGDNLPPFFYFTWVIPGLIEVALSGAFFLKFLKHLPTKARTGFILSAVVYLGGALGFELISGAYTSSYGTENFHFNLLTTIEELLEMLGMVLFIRTLLTYISDTYAGLQLVFLSSTPT